MKRTLLWAILALAAVTAQSQTFEWVRTPPITFSQNPDMIGYPVAVGTSESIYMCGFKTGSHPAGSDILGNVMFNKYSQTGELVFSKTFTGNVTVYELLTDSEENVLMSIGYEEFISIGSFETEAVGQGMQPLLLKFDSSGDFIWAYVPEIPDEFLQHFKAISVDINNNIYLGYDNYMDSFVTKLSPEGTFLQTISQTDVNMVTSVSVDNAGNIYTAGSCADLNPAFAGVSAPLPEGITYNTYVAKYSPEGTFQWVRYIDDITCQEPMVKARTPDEVYFSSALFGPYQFGSITAEGPADNAFTDFFLAKLNTSGDFQWVREVPGENDGMVQSGGRNFLNLDADGNIYFGGRTGRNINWGNGITTSIEGFSNNDVIIMKYNTSGDILMAKTAGGDGYDRVDGISVNSNGMVYVSGMVSGAAHFDDIQTVGTSFYYPFLAKLNNDALGVGNPDLGAIALYPNPASDALWLSNIEQPVKASIFNTLGQKIKDVVVYPGIPTDIHELSNGIYFLKIEDLGSLKFVKA